MTMDTDSRLSETTTSDPHGLGSMGSRPSQAVFLGGLAVALLVFMLAATAFVMLSALTYG
jgi:hypothetical protein